MEPLRRDRGCRKPQAPTHTTPNIFCAGARRCVRQGREEHVVPRGIPAQKLKLLIHQTALSNRQDIPAVHRQEEPPIALQHRTAPCIRSCSPPLPAVLAGCLQRAASSRGDKSGSSSANSTSEARTSSGMRFQPRDGFNGLSSNASTPRVGSDHIRRVGQARAMARKWGFRVEPKLERLLGRDWRTRGNRNAAVFIDTASEIYDETCQDTRQLLSKSNLLVTDLI